VIDYIEYYSEKNVANYLNAYNVTNKRKFTALFILR